MVNHPIKGLELDAFIQARKAKGMGRGELSRLTGLSKTAIRNWESGASSPNIDSLAKAAAALGMTMDQLIKIPKNKQTLADLRRLAGLNQRELSQAMHTSSAAIGDLERGETLLTEDKAQRLAPLLKVSVEELRAAYERARTRPAGTPA